MEYTILNFIEDNVPYGDDALTTSVLVRAEKGVDVYRFARKVNSTINKLADDDDDFYDNSWDERILYALERLAEQSKAFEIIECDTEEVYVN